MKLFIKCLLGGKKTVIWTLWPVFCFIKGEHLIPSECIPFVLRKPHTYIPLGQPPTKLSHKLQTTKVSGTHVKKRWPVEACCLWRTCVFSKQGLGCASQEKSQFALSPAVFPEDAGAISRRSRYRQDLRATVPSSATLWIGTALSDSREDTWVQRVVVHCGPRQQQHRDLLLPVALK